MRTLVILIALLSLVSCDSHRSFDSQAAVEWSKKPDVQMRKKSAIYAFQRSDGSWVSISTARQTETQSGLLYDGGKILESGFITYPGGERAASIGEATEICSRIDGAEYQSEPQR
jgi:hypothetical protein